MIKRRRHTPEQFIRKLREADRLLGEGKAIGEVCRHLEISEPTYHRWRNQFGGAATHLLACRLEHSDAVLEHKLYWAATDGIDEARYLTAIINSNDLAREIAEALVISPATGRTHVSHAMVKLGARDRAQVVVFAYETGLVAPGHGSVRARSARNGAADATYRPVATQPDRLAGRREAGFSVAVAVQPRRQRVL